MLLLGAGLGAVSAQDAVPSGPEPGSSRLEWRAGRHSGTCVVDPDSLRYRLPGGWIDPHTFVLEHGTERLTRGVHFLLDPRRGTLRLLGDFAPGDTVAFRYRAFPLSPQDEFRIHRPFHGEDSTWTASPSLATRETTPFGRLQIAGSKTFAVEVGSQQDFALKQSLDLSVHGMLGRDVTVNAVLTDRDTPLQPEGTSAQLDELDRVLVEVEGPRARMTLGDFLLQLPPSQFAPFDRRLKGVQGEVRPDRVRVSASGASSPGEFRSVEFLGEEGKQGPYALGANNSLVEVPVVAGSETIWFEDRRLTRGEDADYVIDYADGTLTFTGKVPITAYSQITADYQLATDNYPRTVYSAVVSSGLAPDPDALRRAAASAGQSSDPGGASSAEASGSTDLGLRATWLVERDDRHDPRGIPLSESQRQALEDAGDQSVDELRSGIVLVGAGNGSYDQVFVDTLATSFFVYTGADSGAYEIRFERVEEEAGDYAETTDTTGARYYVFVGSDRGDFVPGREIARPQSTAVLSLAGLVHLGPALGLRSEVAVSDHDANTFSRRDDGDNQGVALSAELASVPFLVLGSALSLSGRWRRVDARFRSFDRLDPSYYALDWNLDRERLARGDERIGVETVIERAATRLGLSFETLDNRSDFDARRGTVDLRTRRGPFDLNGRLLRAWTHDTSAASPGRGLRSRDHGRLGWRGPWIEAEARYAYEETRRGQRDTRSGSLFREGTLELGSGQRWSSLGLRLEFTRRNTYDTRGSERVLRDIGRTATAGAEWRRSGGNYLAGTFTRRKLEPRDDRSAISSDLGQLRWLERRADGLLQQESRWELSTAVERRRVERIEFVGPGGGHYDSLGVYQGIGDYEVFVRELADPSRVQRIDASFRTEVDFSRGERIEEGSWLRRALATARLVHSWTARVETERPGAYLWPRMIPILLGRRDLSLVDVRMRADLSLLPNARWASPRLRGEERRFQQGASGGLTEESLFRLLGLRLRSRPADRWSMDLDLESDRDQRTVDLSGRNGRTGWTSTRVSSEHEVALWRRFSGLTRLSRRQRDRIGDSESAVVHEVSPAVVFSPRSRGRVELRTTRTWIDRRGGPDRASRDLEIPGWTSRAVVTLQLRQALDLSLSFRETRPDGGRTVRDARTELRATF